MKFILVCILLSLNVLLFAQFEAQPDTYSIEEDKPSILDVLKNDVYMPASCPTSFIGITITKNAQNGSIQTLGGNKVQYTPNDNYFGADSFEYTISDCNIASGIKSSATVTIDVLPVNDPPIARNDSYIIYEDQSEILDITENDEDIDSDKLVTVTTGTGPFNGIGIIQNSDSVFYSPQLNYFGLDSFLYLICDNALGSETSECDQAWVAIKILPVYDSLSVANEIPFTLEEDSSIKFSVIDSILNIENLALEFSVPDEDSQLISFVGDSICYTPPPNYYGSDTIILTVCDTVICKEINLTFDITPVYDSLSAANEIPFTLEEDSSIKFSIIDSILNIENLALEFSVPDEDSQLVSLVGDSICYTPPADFFGADTITLTVCDTVTCIDIEIIFEVLPQPDFVTAVNDTFKINSQTPIPLDILANDINPDDTELMFTIIDMPLISDIEPDNNVVILQDVLYRGVDSFIYEIDNGYFRDTAMVRLEFGDFFDKAPPPFTLNDDRGTIFIGEDTLIPILENDSLNGNKVTLNLIETGSLSNADLLPDSTVLVTAESEGNDVLKYEVCLIDLSYCDTSNIFVSIAGLQVTNHYQPIIPNSFSPNGDGQNDILLIKNNEHLEDTRLQLFNRWGNIVYDAKPYLNDFNGKNSNSNKDLSEGVYYYTYEYFDTLEERIVPKSGYIVIKR